MITLRFAALLLASLLLTACGPRLSQMPELPQPPQRIVQYGYSFMPPAEKGWHLAGRDGNHIVLGRFGPGHDETLMIVAGNSLTQRLHSSAEFEHYVRELIAKDTANNPDNRFSERKSKITMLKYRGADCARVQMSAIDHLAKTRSGKKADMVLEISQMFCRHPDNVGVVTFLGYSRRYYPGHGEAGFEAKASQLLNSLEFSTF